MSEKHIDFSETYIINPLYNIRSDIKRAVITNSRGVSNAYVKDENINTGFTWIWHPIIAVFFSYFDGSEDLGTTIGALAEDFNIKEEEVQKFVFEVINAEEKGSILFSRLSIYVSTPKSLLIKKKPEFSNRVFDTKSFIIKAEEWDVSSSRLYIPSSVAIMLNNKCYTDCIYCYADKDTKVKNEMSWHRIVELIHECDRIGVGEVTFNGGDLFLYEHWREVLKEVLKYKYEPYISTKYPLTRDQINELKELGVNKIQISLDSDDPLQLQKILKVRTDYHAKMLDTLKYLEEAEILVDVKSVITKYNCEIADVEKLINRLKQYKNTTFISIAPGEASLYKKFDDYKANYKKLEEIDKYIRSFNGQITETLKCNCQGYMTDQFIKESSEEKAKKMTERSMCSGNFSAIFILPDGKVGICEQLYWHPSFIIGDVNESSIMEVWNSQKALDLFEFPQNNFPEESPCRECNMFDYCRYKKGVCWRNIFFAYGMDKIYDPDPDCPYAPAPTQKYYHELS